jgi:LemA protein
MGFSNIVLLLLIVAAIYMVMAYNNLVGMKQRLLSAWSDIEVQLKKRYNLIPALVDTIKGYTKHESETLESVIKARNMALNAHTAGDASTAEAMYKSAVSGLFGLSEAYPDLKANENFINLQNQLQAIEEDIESSRRYYNATVRDYNAKIESFPELYIAKQFSFTPYEYFEVDEAIEADVYKVPKIDL